MTRNADKGAGKVDYAEVVRTQGVYYHTKLARGTDFSPEVEQAVEKTIQNNLDLISGEKAGTPIDPADL